MKINKGDKFHFARIASDEILELTIRTVYEKSIVGVCKGNAYVVSVKDISDLLYKDRKLAVQYLKEHRMIFREEDGIKDEN